MQEFEIKLQTIKDVQTFVNTVTKFNFAIEMHSGQYVVNAKSILGVFSLDLSAPITITAHTEDAGDFKAAIKPFLA